MDISKELHRLASSRPDVAQFFIAHLHTPGAMAALELLLEQRALARECVYERANGRGGHDTNLRFHPVVLASHLCRIAGVQHRTPFDDAYIEERRAVDLANTTCHPTQREAGSGA